MVQSVTEDIHSEKENRIMGNGILQSISENLQFLLVCAVVIAVIIGVSELF